MRLAKRAAITVTPKQPYLDWVNAIDDGVKIGQDFWPERHVCILPDQRVEKSESESGKCVRMGKNIGRGESTMLGQKSR